MPYIKPEQKDLLDTDQFIPNSPGELNYCITKLLLKYQLLKGVNYQTINDVLGALEGAKLEYYRRVGTVYEEAKILENGDVYK